MHPNSADGVVQDSTLISHFSVARTGNLYLFRIDISSLISLAQVLLRIVESHLSDLVQSMAILYITPDIGSFYTLYTLGQYTQWALIKPSCSSMMCSVVQICIGVSVLWSLFQTCYSCIDRDTDASSNLFLREF